MNDSIEQIEATIKQIVCEHFGIDESEFHPDLNFKDDLAGDSLDLVELVMDFEDQLDINISDDVAEMIKTPRDIFEYVITKDSEEEFKEEF